MRVDPALALYDSKHAVLLPYDRWISVLITNDAHLSGHPGIVTTTTKTRRKYWIVKGNKLSKLPTSRLQPLTPPFMFTSCDYFGLIKVKISRNKTAKHYGVLFTCLNTKAIHCKLATDTITMEFLQVLRRLFFYSGYPKVMLSDNRWQMVGAERELSLMIEGWDKTKLSEYCADRGMKWQFTTPLAPHQKGCCEVLVKSTKSTLKKALGKAVRTPFEPYTCLFEVANLLNERPIGRIPNDPDDGACLCPNDIILGRATNRVPKGPFHHMENPHHRLEFCQKIVVAFWKRWYRDVLPQLMPRKKWST